MLWTVIAGLTATPLLAEPEIKNPLETGEQFLAYCEGEGDDPYSAIGFGVCLGFIQGIAAREATLPSAERQFCLPPAISWGDEYDIVVRFLRAHPDRRHLPASLLTMAALRQAFPCPSQ
jgi:hypothetical protein